VCRRSLIMNPSSQLHLTAPGPPRYEGGGDPSCTAPSKCPSSCAATMIPENPPVSSTMATLFTFSNLLLTTQAPPTYANPAVPLLQSPCCVFLLHISNLVMATAISYTGSLLSRNRYFPMSVKAEAASIASLPTRFLSRYGVASRPLDMIIPAIEILTFGP